LGAKYRRKTLTLELLEYLETAFAKVLAAWRCKWLEFGGEPDPVVTVTDADGVVLHEGPSLTT